MNDRDLIAKILKENITFSSQVDGYVIHGAIDEILKHFEPLKKENERLKEMAKWDKVWEMLIEFGLQCHKSPPKDISNDASEYLSDKLKSKS